MLLVCLKEDIVGGILELKVINGLELKASCRGFGVAFDMPHRRRYYSGDMVAAGMFVILLECPGGPYAVCIRNNKPILIRWNRFAVENTTSSSKYEL